MAFPLMQSSDFLPVARRFSPAARRFVDLDLKRSADDYCLQYSFQYYHDRQKVYV
jgi:hypothetical protein